MVQTFSKQLVHCCNQLQKSMGSLAGSARTHTETTLKLSYTQQAIKLRQYFQGSICVLFRNGAYLLSIAMA